MVTMSLTTIPPPDLKNDAHRAVGLHFKLFEKHADLAWDNKNRRWLERSAFETKVAIYEDRVRGWFLDCAARLQADHNAGFVVLMVAVAYLEGNEQYRRGSTSNKKSEKYFVSAHSKVPEWRTSTTRPTSFAPSSPRSTTGSIPFTLAARAPSSCIEGTPGS